MTALVMTLVQHDDDERAPHHANQPDTQLQWHNNNRGAAAAAAKLSKSGSADSAATLTCTGVVCRVQMIWRRGRRQQ